MSGCMKNLWNIKDRGNMSMIEKRTSNIELFRIFSMLLVLIAHFSIIIFVFLQVEFSK